MKHWAKTLFGLWQSFCLDGIKRVRLGEIGGQVFYRYYYKSGMLVYKGRKGNFENFETTLCRHKFFLRYILQ